MGVLNQDSGHHMVSEVSVEKSACYLRWGGVTPLESCVLFTSVLPVVSAVFDRLVSEPQDGQPECSRGGCL